MSGLNSIHGVDGDQLIDRLHKMGTIGRDNTGKLTRLAATDEDQKARNTLVRWAKDVGLRVDVDCVGNILATLETPSNQDRPPLVIGSHIDSVVDAGIYDGCYGVLAGVSVLQALRANAQELTRPVLVAAFTNEEGVRFSPDLLGSRVFSGLMSPVEALAVTDASGRTLGSELDRIGYNGEPLQRALRPHAYIELHIEQGPILDSTATAIGVVEGIQGTRWWRLTFEGAANHAGTTPLDLRRDAGRATVVIAHNTNEYARSNRNLVATIGQISLEPNAINVISSRAEITLDVRSPHERELEKFALWLSDRCNEVSFSCNVRTLVEEIAATPPVYFSDKIQKEIERAAAARGLSYRKIASGANHDAQNFPDIVPTGMIFVPSIGGVSHNPAEFTSPEDLIAGANILLDVVSTLVMENDV